MRLSNTHFVAEGELPLCRGVGFSVGRGAQVKRSPLSVCRQPCYPWVPHDHPRVRVSNLDSTA